MADSIESVEFPDDFECIDGIYVERSNTDEEKKNEKKGKFSNFRQNFHVWTEMALILGMTRRTRCRFGFLHPQSFILIGPRWSEILQHLK